MIKIVLRVAFMTPPLEKRDISDIEENRKLARLNLRPTKISEVYIDPECLPISKDLAKAISDWDTDYQSTFDHLSPQSSGFLSQNRKYEHIKTGERLADRLQAELGDSYNVKYIPLD